VLIFVFLAGCANQSVVIPPSSSRTPTLRATNTPTAAILSQPTSTATSSSRFTRQCLPVPDNEADLKDVASGAILLEQVVPDVSYQTVISTDIQTGKKYKLFANTKNAFNISSAISPDRKMIALMEVDFKDQQTVSIRNVLWVFNTQAKVLSKITFDRTDLGKLRWLDNERLLIDTDKYGTLLLVYPVTGEQRVIADELPNPYRYFEIGNWWPVVYSPDLEWATYYENTLGPVVYDVVTKQIIWKAGGGMGDPAVWSPDGQEVALNTGIGEYQLYIIKRSGQSKAVLGASLLHDAHAFSWSPDGHFIAFWNGGSLLVYDRQMGWVFDTCIRGSEGGHFTPVWSPDSRQIMTRTYLTPGTLFLVDWQKKVAYKIKEDKSTQGIIYDWMNSLP